MHQLPSAPASTAGRARCQSASRPRRTRCRLNHQVNALLGRLGDAVDNAIAGIDAFVAEHPELEQEGRDAMQRWLQISANQLLEVAQKLDGR